MRTPIDQDYRTPALELAVPTRRIVMASAVLLLAGANTPGHAFLPTTTRKNAAMSDPRVETYRKYLSAWSAMPDDQRARLLSESLSQGIVFTNPTQTRRGISDVILHLQGFQERTPGGSFRMNEMLGWGTNGIATWQFVDAKGQPGFWGYDVLAFDAHGRIESILLFGHVQAQTLT